MVNEFCTENHLVALSGGRKDQLGLGSAEPQVCRLGP